MPNILDSFFVEIGLDSSKFVAGEKAADEAFDKTKDRAAQAGEEMEESGKQAARFFSQIRGQVIQLFAAFTAGRGLKEFVADTVAGEVHLGRLAVIVGATVRQLSEWRGAIALSGGRAEDIDAAFQGLTAEFQQFSLTGESSVIPYFRALGVNISDATGRMKPMDQLLGDIADKFKGLDPVRAAALARGMHLPPDLVPTLIFGREALNKYLEEMRRLGVVTEADRKAGLALVTGWRSLMFASESLGRTLLTELTPILTKALKVLTDLAVWARQHGPFLDALFAGLAVGAAALGAAFLAPVAAIAGWIALIVAAATAVALLADDWYIWLTGGKSALGGFYDFVAKIFKKIGKVAADTVADIIRLFSGFDGLKRFGRGVLNVVLGPKTAAQLFDEPTFKDRFAPTEEKPLGRPRAVSSGRAYAGASSDVDKLVAMGWTRPQAIGIVANLARESRGSTSATGDSGTAFGLAQWHPDRQRAFAQWAGHDIRSATRDEQLAFINFELRRGSEQAAGRRLAATTTAGDAAKVVSSSYERPGDQAGEAERRAVIAAALDRAPATGLAPGAQTAAAAANVTNSSKVSTSTSMSDVRIGQVVVNTQATDAETIAKDIKPAMERNSFAQQSNYGAN